MPVRDGRWVPWSEVIAEAKAIAADAEVPAEDLPVTAKRSRRSPAAAAAAIAEATGAVVNFDVVPEPVEQEEPE